MNIVFIKLQKINFCSLPGNEEIDITGHVCVYPQKKAERVCSCHLPYGQALPSRLVTGARRPQPPVRASLRTPGTEVQIVPLPPSFARCLLLQLPLGLDPSRALFLTVSVG